MSPENRRSAPHLGEGCAALEDQVPPKRGFEENIKSRHNPDVLLEEEGRVRAPGLGGAQGIAAIGCRKTLKLRVNHVSSARSAALPSTSA